MYSRELTVLDYPFERPLALNQTVEREGQALIAVMEDGVEKTKVSAGAGGEKLIGFAKSTRTMVDRSIFLDSFVIPAAPGPFVVDLGVINIEVGQLQVKLEGVVMTIVGGAPAATGEVNVDYLTGILTFHSADAEKNISVLGKKILSVDEARSLYREGHINSMKAFEAFGVIGVMSGKGEIYIDTYDVNGDFAAGTLKLMANGLIGTSGGGVDISAMCRVVHVPTIDNSFLGLAINI